MNHRFPWAKWEKNGQSVVRDFFSLILFFHKLECTGEKGENSCFLNMNKKSSTEPFLAHSGGGQETTFI